MTETDILLLLAKKYAPPEYAFLTQVRNGTGFGRAVNRTADALAFSLWPSRGLSLSGFEIKVSKSDLKREIVNPEKAEEIAQYCDYWWIVVPNKEMVGSLQVPDAWGVMTCDDDDGIHVEKDATKTPVIPLDRLMVCAIMKRAQTETPSAVELRRVAKDAYDRGRACGEAIKKSLWLRQQEDYKQLVANLRKFHAVTGIDLQQSYNLDHKIEEWSKLKKLMDLSYDFPRGMPGLLDMMVEDLGNCVSRGESLLARLGELKTAVRWGEKDGDDDV